MKYLRAARDLGVWMLIGAQIMLGGCAITTTDGTKSFGVFPIAAPEPKTVTIDKALTVAARIEVAGYGGIFFGFSSGLRARVPVLCLDDGRCFVPKLSTNTNATTSFQGGTTVTDGVSIDGFIELESSAIPAATPIVASPIRLSPGLRAEPTIGSP